MAGQGLRSLPTPSSKFDPPSVAVTHRRASPLRLQSPGPLWPFIVPSFCFASITCAAFGCVPVGN
jgi:hypothetical protein